MCEKILISVYSLVIYELEFENLATIHDHINSI